MIYDCCRPCCTTPAPVNVVGAPGLAGTPGPAGALVLLGELYADFQYTAAYQSIPINALQYVITQVIITQNTDDLLASVGGIYQDNGGLTALVTPWTFAGDFPMGTWRDMPLAAAAQSTGYVLTGSEIFLILTVASDNAAKAYVKVYGYVL